MDHWKSLSGMSSRFTTPSATCSRLLHVTHGIGHTVWRDMHDAHHTACLYGRPARLVRLRPHRSHVLVPSILVRGLTGLRAVVARFAVVGL